MSPLRYAVVGLAVAAIAWPTAPPRARDGLSGSEWRVVELAGASAAGAGTLRFTLTSVRGKAACNSFFGSFRETGEAIEILGLNGTRMFCQGRMELESAYLDALSKARSYRLDHGVLMLLDTAGKALVKLSG